MEAGEVPLARGPAWCPVARHAGVAALTLVVGVACVGERARALRQTAEGMMPSALLPDELPVLLNERSPFAYPESAWAQRIQGNVLLRLHVAADGRAVRESTTVVQTSGVPSLDSAAVAAVPALRFRPARTNGRPVGVSLRFPVHYRHPDGPPMPGDPPLP
jgi:protein TonB